MRGNKAQKLLVTSIPFVVVSIRLVYDLSIFAEIL
jgi:hypothetical protein